jgi:type IV fimbrial biogenesis protein FimT
MINTRENSLAICRPVQCRARRAAGFTLIELMIVLVILAAVLVIGLPSFSSAALVSRLKSYANEMVASVYLARSEAIKRNTATTLCMSADGNACTTSGDWEQGWIVVVDPNDPTTVLRYYEPLSGDYKLTGYIDPNDPTSTAFQSMVFDPSGVGVAVDGVVRIGTMNLCRLNPSPGHQERKVTVSATGRTRVTTTEEGVCTP